MLNAPVASTLVLVNRLPYPLEDGWRVRAYHMIRAVAERGPVTVISYGNADDEAAAAFRAALGPRVRLRLVPHGRRYTPWRLLRGLVGPLPIQVVAEQSDRFRRALREEAAALSPDLVLCELTAMYDLLDALPQVPPVVVDTHNIDSLVLQRYADVMRPSPRRFYARLSSRKLAAYERHVFRAADAIVVCSEVEASALRATLPAQKVWVVPNGVDFQRMASRGASTVPGRLLFFGRLDYFPNRDAIDWFVRDILPSIRRTHPGVEFHVAGAGGEGELAQALQAMPGVVFHGKVQDLGALVESAAVVVVPLRSGGGTRLKIIEALALQRPLVSTAIGAEGLDLEHGKDLMLADEAPSFAATVGALLDDPARARALGEQGAASVQRHYDWMAIEAGLRQRIAGLGAPMLGVA